MRTRDRVISFVIVLLAIAAIWYAASLFHGHANPETDAGSDDATADAPAIEAGAPVLAVPPPPADAGAVAVVVDAAPPISPACQKLADGTTKVLAAARAVESCIPEPDLSGTACASREKGTWGFRVDEVQRLSPPLPGEACGDWGYLVDLVHVDDKGVEVSEIPDSYLFQTLDGGKTFKFNVNARMGLGIAGTRFFDFDGNGEDEVYVNPLSNALGGTKGGALLAWKGGKIGVYEPASSFRIHALEDVDADGRPDLVLDTFKTTYVDEKLARVPATTLRGLAHSLPDGSFSTKDAVAAGYVQKQCPTPPKFEAGGVVTDGDTIACALFWGAAAKDLEPLLAKSPPWTRDLAKEKPPVVLR